MGRVVNLIVEYCADNSTRNLIDGGGRGAAWMHEGWTDAPMRRAADRVHEAASHGDVVRAGLWYD